jgi:hypothetical protein
MYGLVHTPPLILVSFFLIPVYFNETWVTNLFHRQEDFQIELRNDADHYIPFARTALIERQSLTKFPKLRHKFTDENIKIQRN